MLYFVVMIWFVRERNKPLEQVLSFHNAEILARKRSRKNASGIMETVVEDNGRHFVDAVFLRGRKLQQGKRARDSSKLGLPPKV